MEKKRILETERGSTGPHFVEKYLWKKLWTCRETEYRMNNIVTTCIPVCLMSEERRSVFLRHIGTKSQHTKMSQGRRPNY